VNFPQGTQFDICLFWDLLIHLDGPLLRAFTDSLFPYIHPRTRAF
jgi:hypothetical protein